MIVASLKQIEQIDIQRHVNGENGAHSYKSSEKPPGEPTHHKRIKHVGYIFIHQRPHGSVERIRLPPAAHIKRRRRRKQQAGHKENTKQCQNRGSGHRRTDITGRRVKCKEPECSSHHHHRMQTHEPAAQKHRGCHPPLPPVIIGIAYHKTRKCEKEVNRKIAVVDNLISRPRRISLEYMKHYYNDGCYPSQPVKDFKTRSGIQI